MSVQTKLGWSVCAFGILLVYLPFGLTRAPADGFLHLFITDPSLLQRWAVTGLGFVVAFVGVIIAGKAYQKRDDSRGSGLHLRIPVEGYRQVAQFEKGAVQH